MRHQEEIAPKSSNRILIVHPIKAEGLIAMNSSQAKIPMPHFLVASAARKGISDVTENKQFFIQSGIVIRHFSRFYRDLWYMYYYKSTYGSCIYSSRLIVDVL